MTRRRNSRRTIYRNTGIESLEPREVLAIAIFQGPGPQVRAEDSPAVFGAGFSPDSQFYLAFEDSSATNVFYSSVTAHIEALDGGKITVPGHRDVTTTGNGTESVTVVGPVWTVNTLALNGIRLYPPKDFVGLTSAKITIISGTDSASASATLKMQTTAVNDFPSIAGPSASASIPFNGSLAFTGSRRITVSDVDSPNPRMRVELSGLAGYLTLATKSGLTFLSGDGTSDTYLKFEGSRNSINAALDGLTYKPFENSTGTGKVTIYVNDLGSYPGPSSLSASRSFEIDVRPNVAPVINGLSGTASYTENRTPTRVAPTATLADADSANLSGGTLTATIALNRSNADVLSVMNQSPGTGRITLSGNVVAYSGIEIGSFAGGTNGVPLTVNLNANATPAAVQALMRNIAFSVESEKPTTAVRTVRFVVTDGDGGTSRPGTRQINVVAVNDPPVIRNVTGTVDYTRGKSPIRIAAAALVTDVDHNAFNGGILTVNSVSGSNSMDRLTLLGYVIDSSGKISRNGKLIGTKNTNGGVGTTRLSIRLTTNATPAEVQFLVRSVLFETSSTSTTNRVLEITLSDGGGGTSAAVRRTIRIL